MKNMKRKEYNLKITQRWTGTERVERNWATLNQLSHRSTRAYEL